MSERARWTSLGVLAAVLGEAPREHEPPFPADVAAAAATIDLGAETVHLAWEIAALLRDATPERQRALLLLVLALLAAQRDGSTRMPLAGGAAARGPLGSLLAALGASDADRLAVDALLAAAGAGDASLAPIVGGAGDYRPLLVVDGHLYPQRAWQLERRVVEALLARLAPSPEIVAEAAVEEALADLRARPARDRNGRPVPLSGEQETALRTVLGGGLAVLTGGPGTGKTWVVAALLRVLARLGANAADDDASRQRMPSLRDVALAAPTGKASDRLQASLRGALLSIEQPAAADLALLASPPRTLTLHRLLSYSPSGELFRHHERNPLAERLVVVDESSMVDLALAERLLRALRPDARLLLVGDAQQLPSVDAGAVFRDLVDAAAARPRVARLEKSFRMDSGDAGGRAILALAQGIAGGLIDETALAVRPRADELTFAGAELLLVPPATLAALLDRWWRERVQGLADWRELVTRTWPATDGAIAGDDAAALEPLFRHHESFRLLTATRGWSAGTGAAAINDWFRTTLRRELGEARRAAALDALQPALGEPVLVTRNDYRHGLFNGDQGLVLRVAERDGEPLAMVVLRGARSFRAFPLATLRGAVEPAWASTVHKAQGSEHDHVAVVLPAGETRLLTRELLYTAVTRARRSVVIAGARERLAAAAARAVERWSGIAEGLGGRVGMAATAAPAADARAARKRDAGQLPLPF